MGQVNRPGWQFALCLGAVACGRDPTGPALGSIDVAVAVTGADSTLRPGLAVSLDQGPSKTLSELETRFTNLESGIHTIRLENLALNCTVAGSNPVSVTVTSGRTVEVHFAIACSDPGTLIVVTQTTAANGARPESYGLTLDGQPVARIAANGRTAMPLGAGNHTLELTEVPASCATGFGTVDEFSVAAGDTTEIRFEVSCPPPPPPGQPTITVTVSTEGFLGGPIDTNGYDVLLDDVLTTHVGSNGTARLTPVDPGPHSVALAGFDSGCTYAGAQQVAVPDSGNMLVHFRVHCFLPGIP